MKPKKTTLCYKVIRKKDRNSYIIEEPEFIINYPKNKVIKKIPNTIGICCFKYKYHAIDFCSAVFDPQETPVTIIPVLGIGKPKIPVNVLRFPLDRDNYYLKIMYKLINFKDFWSDIPNNLHCLISAPKGTICFDSIITLE